MKTLDTLKIGESSVVKELLADGLIKRRFMDMGITTGTNITLQKSAILGGPIAIEIRGYTLSLRRCEAKKIVLEG